MGGCYISHDWEHHSSDQRTPGNSQFTLFTGAGHLCCLTADRWEAVILSVYTVHIYCKFQGTGRETGYTMDKRNIIIITTFQSTII